MIEDLTVAGVGTDCVDLPVGTSTASRQPVHEAFGNSEQLGSQDFYLVGIVVEFSEL